MVRRIVAEDYEMRDASDDMPWFEVYLRVGPGGVPYGQVEAPSLAAARSVGAALFHLDPDRVIVHPVHYINLGD